MEITQFWNFFHIHRSKIILLLVLLAIPEIADAQMNLRGHDNKRLHFGILLGYNSTRFQVVHSEEFINNETIKVLDSPSTPGFNLGIVSNLKITKHVDLRLIPTLIFAEKKLRYTEFRANGDAEVVETIESIYLDIPVGFKFKSDRFYDNFRFYILAGGKADFDLASNSKKRRANDIIKLGVLDVSAEVGFGFEFYFPLFIFSPEFKVAHGLNNVHVPTDNLIQSQVISKLRSRTFTISLQFEG